MTLLITTVLLLAAAPQDPAPGPDPAAREEAIADLERRTGLHVEGAGTEERPQQEDPRPQHPETPLEPPAAKADQWIDFDWLELHAGAGMAIFSKVFHISPSPAFAIAARAPVPLLSPSDNPDGDYFGVFSQLDVAMIKRTIKPSVAKPSGAFMGLTVGVDYTIFRTSTWLLLARAGFQYATYGGVTDLKDGIAPVVGLTGGLSISRSVSVTLSPEYIQGKKDNIILGLVGVAIDF